MPDIFHGKKIQSLSPTLIRWTIPLLIWKLEYILSHQFIKSRLIGQCSMCRHPRLNLQHSKSRHIKCQLRVCMECIQCMYSMKINKHYGSWCLLNTLCSYLPSKLWHVLTLSFQYPWCSYPSSSPLHKWRQRFCFFSEDHRIKRNV